MFSSEVYQNPLTLRQNQPFLSRGSFLQQYPTPDSSSCFQTLRGVCTCPWGCADAPNLMFCLLIKWKCASSPNLFADMLAEFVGLVLVGPALSLKNFHFVRKQLLVSMNDSYHRTGNPHFLWQPSGGLWCWLFQTSPSVLNMGWRSGCQTCTTVGLVVCHTASVSEL